MDEKKAKRALEKEAQPDQIEETLKQCGLSDLQAGASLAAIEEAVVNLQPLVADCDDIRRALVREAAIKKLKEVGLQAPAQLIDAAIKPNETATATTDQGKTLFLVDPEPWDKPVNGDQLLQSIESLIKKYVALSPESAHAVALWIMHAWTLDAFDISPFLFLTSPIKRCGKTTLLEIIAMLSPRAISTANITGPALFRAIEKFRPTLCIDEADAFVGEKDELRGILNSGHRRATAFVVRCEGEDNEPKLFSTWAPKAVAGIGKIPATLEDRSIIISMKRRAPGEVIDRFRSAEAMSLADPLRRFCVRWAQDNFILLREARPETPSSLHDRAADNWTPLLAIAERADGQWPGRARAAALALSEEEDEAPALVELLVELQEIFKTRDRISSAELTEHLTSKLESRWVEWRNGKPVSQRQIARLLAPLKIRPDNMRVVVADGRERVVKGYFKAWFDDAFSRYTPLFIRYTATNQQNQSVTPKTDPLPNPGVADRKSNLSNGKDRDVADVADETPLPDGRDGGADEILFSSRIKEDDPWPDK